MKHPAGCESGLNASAQAFQPTLQSLKETYPVAWDAYHKTTTGSIINSAFVSQLEPGLDGGGSLGRK